MRLNRCNQQCSTKQTGCAKKQNILLYLNTYILVVDNELFLESKIEFLTLRVDIYLKVSWYQ